MHLPDGLLDLKTAGLSLALGAISVGLASIRARATLPARKIPLLGVAGAFVFAAQMVNFPILGGTSGHLMGALLIAVLLGPSAAVVVMSAVLLLQCLLFGDGGLLALGANVLNMAVVGAVGGHAVYFAIRRVLGGTRGMLVASAFAAWASVVMAATACALELALSGTAPPASVLPPMVLVHFAIGAGEAIITALVLSAIARARPELLAQTPGPFPRRVLVPGLVVALGVAMLLAPFASSWPDGLERVTQGWARTPGFAWAVPFADYAFPSGSALGQASPLVQTAIAGLAGTLLMFLVALGLAFCLRPLTRSRLTGSVDEKR